MRILGITQKVGLIGWPVGHSYSPLIHNAAFEFCGLDYVYVPLPVQPGNLSEAVAGLKSLGFVGANVTVPHKVEIMAYLDEIDEQAKQIGAVNTIVVKEGVLTGYNTDAPGFLAALKGKGCSLAGKNALLLGAGGAARAVAAALAPEVACLTIAARRREQADELANLFLNRSVNTVTWPSNEWEQSLSKADLIIHSTPMGMSPQVEAEPVFAWNRCKTDTFFCDLIYNPLETLFLQKARGQGYPVLGGLAMLVEQAALAFEIWTGQEAPRSKMMDVAAQAVKASL
ncbi:MAG: shikimate dehydrogenase [Sporomusaceae bacterium]|nr:shikimate dehydrogenase [Sporomusaceae bacterium]